MMFLVKLWAIIATGEKIHTRQLTVEVVQRVCICVWCDVLTHESEEFEISFAALA